VLPPAAVRAGPPTTERFPYPQYDWYVTAAHPVSRLSVRKLTFRYRRLIHWLSKVRVRSGPVPSRPRLTAPAQQPAWGRSREFDITTRSVGRNAVTQSTTGDLFDDEEEDDALVHGHKKRRVAFEPSPGQSIPDPNPVLFPINPLGRNDTHHLLPRSLAQGGSRAQPTSPCPLLNPQRSPERNAARTTATRPS
jgi:hypothetical protein